MRERLKSFIFDQIAMLLCAIFVFNILPCSVEAAEKADGKVVVSMGDSYASGEGIDNFYGTDKSLDKKVKDEDWLAHRSQNSWAGQLRLKGMPDGKSLKDYKTNYKNVKQYNLDEDYHWFFVASSGAETKHIDNKQRKLYNKYGKTEKAYLAPQLDVLKKLGNQVDYVTISIGGNDVGFADIMMNAAVPDGSVSNLMYGPSLGVIDFFAPCFLVDKINKTWNDFEIAKYNIATSYVQILYSAKNAEVLVAGYPTLLSLEADSVFYSYSDAVIINSAVNKFNQKLNEIVTMVNTDLKIDKLHFVSVETEFKGHEAYSKNGAYINSVIIPPKEEDLIDKNIVKYSDPDTKKTKWNLTSAYSIHPNMTGAKKYAECVQSVLNSFEGIDVVQPASAKPESTTAVVTTKPPETTKKAQVLSAEEAAGIYFDNLSVWHSRTDELLSPDEGVRYTFLDLDFDGINELAVSTTVDSELTTDNTFYKIDKATKTVKKMQSANGNNLNQLPFLVGGNELNLLKSSQDKYVYYFTGEYLPNGGAGYSQTDFGIFYCDNGKVKTEMKFWETYLAAGVIPYMGAEENGDGPFDTNTFKYGYYQGESMTETSQATYNKMKNDFLTANPKVSLSYKVIDGRSFDSRSNVEKKQLLLNSYKAFSYK